MHVLTLHVGQSITLSNGIRVTVTRLDDASGRALLGIEAPANIAILREELLDHSHPLHESQRRP